MVSVASVVVLGASVVVALFGSSVEVIETVVSEALIVLVGSGGSIVFVGVSVELVRFSTRPEVTGASVLR